MVSGAEIRGTSEFVEWLRQQVHEKQLPATVRVRAAGGCLALAQEHHHSIVFLVEHKLYGSAFALVRLAFEAYVRGEWLALCASDTAVENFVAGKEPPKIDVLLTELARTPAFEENVLGAVKAKGWRAMCDYTHTGGRHVQRWNSADAIEASYDDAEVREVLSFAEVIGALAVLGLASLAGDNELALRVLEKVKQRAA